MFLELEVIIQSILKMVISKLTFVHLKKLLKMNNIHKEEKEFDTVKFFRQVKEKIAKETKGMTFVELKEYINSRKLRLVK